ncbi:MAG: hypothetical protein GWN87_30675 [Desulfuromonadales bacterium]|nr:hypothetical protein [Desulfuromonadales bacterium]NIS43929.1 hypothetical protein [Desulfuromonadales bacterium]
MPVSVLVSTVAFLKNIGAFIGANAKSTRDSFPSTTVVTTRWCSENRSPGDSGPEGLPLIRFLETT